MDTNILAAVIGGIIGLIPFLFTLIYTRKEREHQHYKFVYVKFYHLTRRNGTNPPVYRRYVQRLKDYVDVYDEAHYSRLNIFDKEQNEFTCIDRSSGVVDLHILYPWHHKLIFPDKGAGKIPGMIMQTIKEKSTTFFTRTVYLNGFQEGNEDFAMRIEHKTKEARMIIDFSSLPGYESLFKTTPSGYRRTGTMHGELDVQEVYPGVYAVSCHNVEKDEVIVIEFDVDWVAVDNQVPVEHV